jgi:glycosyltransferase involved in cell wall biosynthesis
MKDFLIITGSYPPDICGVGGAIAMAVNTKVGQGWVVYYRKDWSCFSFLRHIKAIKETKTKYILMIFPTRGYGWSLVPHLICVYFSLFTNKRFGVILHEQSQLSFKAYLAELLILFSANRIIFTTQFERNFAIKRIPFIKKRSTVIKIYSNISASTTIRHIEDRSIDVINFGQIIPLKGIEKFIIDVTPFTNHYKVVLAGQIPPMFTNYYKKIEFLCKKNNIQLKINLDQTAVSELLNNTKVAYLPFPDGVSERRGSLLASLLNGAVVVTTFGKFTTNDLAKATIDISKQSLQSILSNNILLNTKQQAGLYYTQTQLYSWENIAKAYEDFLKDNNDS